MVYTLSPLFIEYFHQSRPVLSRAVYFGRRYFFSNVSWLSTGLFRSFSANCASNIFPKRSNLSESFTRLCNCSDKGENNQSNEAVNNSKPHPVFKVSMVIPNYLFHFPTNKIAFLYVYPVCTFYYHTLLHSKSWVIHLVVIFVGKVYHKLSVGASYNTNTLS